LIAGDVNIVNNNVVENVAYSDMMYDAPSPAF
jgi:hypothetical protein